MLSVGAIFVLLIVLSIGLTGVGYVVLRVWAWPTQQDHRARLNEASAIATIGGAILAVAALLAGLVTYNLTTQYQNRAEATSTLQSYAAMRVEHPRPKPRLKEDNGELNDTYGWVALQAFAASETMYLANPNDEGWVLTAREIINDEYVSDFATDEAWDEEGWFDCDYYNPRFISEVVEEQLGDGVCKHTFFE